MTRRGISTACVAALLLASAPVESAADDRTIILLTAAERAHLLEGMRTYLTSVQEITEALGAYKPDRAAAAARRSGSKMLADITPATALKLPLEFTGLSITTHQQFDALAEKAERHVSRSELLGDLAAILLGCNGCHAAFRVETAR